MFSSKGGFNRDVVTDFDLVHEVLDSLSRVACLPYRIIYESFCLIIVGDMRADEPISRFLFSAESIASFLRDR